MNFAKALTIAAIATAAIGAQAADEREMGINAAVCVGITTQLSQYKGDRYDRASTLLGGIADARIKRGFITVEEMMLSVQSGMKAAKANLQSVKILLPVCMSVL